MHTKHAHPRTTFTHTYTRTHTRTPVSHSGLFARSVCGTSQKFPVKFPFISCRKRLLFSFAEPPSQTDAQTEAKAEPETETETETDSGQRERKGDRNQSKGQTRVDTFALCS